MNASRKSKKVDSVSLLLYGTGIFFLLGAFYNWYNIPKEPIVNPELYDVTESPFSFQSLLVSSDYQFDAEIEPLGDGELIFLYVMLPDPCNACINEVTGFVNLAEEKGFAGKRVRNIGLFLHPDKKRHSDL